jgi:hypothetical protein
MKKKTGYGKNLTKCFRYVFYVKIGKCFPFDKERKTLSCDKRQFFSLTGKNFPLTNFSDGCQTWKNEENRFQEFGFFETNKALNGGLRQYCLNKNVTGEI